MTNKSSIDCERRLFRRCRRCGRFRMIRQRDRFYGWTCDECLRAIVEGTGESRRMIKGSLRERYVGFLSDKAEGK